MTSRRPIPLLLSLLALLVTLVVAGVGCRGEDDPTETEASSAQPPPIQPSEPQKKPGQGPGTVREQLAREVELPEDYPEDAPRYPGAKINASAWRQGRVAATFSTKDTPDKVKSYVEQQLASNGWESAPATEFDSGIVLGAAKLAEGRTISVMIATLDQGDDDWVTLIAVVTDPASS